MSHDDGKPSSPPSLALCGDGYRRSRTKPADQIRSWVNIVAPTPANKLRPQASTEDAWTEDASQRKCPPLRRLLRREIGGLTQRLDQAALVGAALAGDIESSAVIDRGADHRQADGDVHAGFQPQHLDRSMALIVIHRDHHVVVAAAGQEEQRIGGERAPARPRPATAGL